MRNNISTLVLFCDVQLNYMYMPHSQTTIQKLVEALMGLSV